MILFVFGVWTWLRALLVSAASASFESVALRHRLAVL